MRPQSNNEVISAHKRQKGVRPKAYINATTHWLRPGVSLTAVLPQQQPFRHDPKPKVDVVLLPDEDGRGLTRSTASSPARIAIATCT